MEYEIALHEEAQKIHEDIIVQERIAAQSLTQIAYDLKLMRDKKLYACIGYSDFEDYCERGTKTGKRQAYNLISLIEEYKLDGLDRVSFLGSTKLLELKKLAPAERDELIESGEAEALSVRALKEKITELQNKNEQLGFDMSELQQSQSLRIQTAEELRIALQKKEEELQKYTDKVKELESRPIEVAVAEPSEADIKKITDKAEKEYKKKLKEESEKAALAAKAEYEVKLKKEVEKATQDAKELYEAKLKEEASKMQSIAQPSGIEDRKDMLKIRVKNIQAEFNSALDLISAFPDEEQSKYKEVLKKVVDSISEVLK